MNRRLSSRLQSGIPSGLAVALALAFTSAGHAQAPAADAPAPATAPYRDPSLPIDRRVGDLVSRMTRDEKISQMQDRAAAIPRLGVPSYDWWNEGLHGVAFGGYATNFPQVIGMAATWDTDLVHRMAETISTEARAKYDKAMREDHHERFFGLTFWAPNVNIFRDPRWGRGQETYGEDPFLTGRMAVAFVTGMQGDDPKYLKVVSTPKHFDVHSGPEPLRHGFNVDVSPRDLEDTYAPAFRAAVAEAHAQSVMCAYNAVDGFPACASTMLLQDHLRDAWRFDGYVVSDCAAVADIATGHKFAPDFAHAAAAAVKAGTDLECQYGEGKAYPALPEALDKGLLTEADLDRAVKRLFTARFRLGMFDPLDSYAYGRIPFAEVNSAQHRKLALQAAREAIVLLKNDHGFLPLPPTLRSIAVVGPTAELVQSLQGNYNGTPPDPITPIAGIERRFKDAKVLYAQGSTLAEGFAVPIAHTALRTADGKEGLTGEYFSSPDLSGKAAAVRVDRTVNFNWDKAIPVAGLQRNNFSVRWTGTLTPPAPGDYTLGARVAPCYACESHEQFRLYVDDKLVTETSDQRKAEARLHFDDTRPHALRLEYRHGTAAAGIDLTWQPPATAVAQEAVAVAKQADVVVAFVGLSPQLEGEEMPVELEGFKGGDRTDIRLPAGPARAAPDPEGHRQAAGRRPHQRQRPRHPRGRPPRERGPRSVVPRRGGRHGHRRDPGGRQQPRRPPAPHLLRVHRPAPAVRGLLDGEPHVPLLHRHAALRLRLWAQLLAVRVRQSEGVEPVSEGGGAGHRGGRREERRRARRRRGRRGLSHAAQGRPYAAPHPRRLHARPPRGRKDGARYHAHSIRGPSARSKRRATGSSCRERTACRRRGPARRVPRGGEGRLRGYGVEDTASLSASHVDASTFEGPLGMDRRRFGGSASGAGVRTRLPVV